MSYVLDNWEKTKSLPLGHYAKKKAEKAVYNVYKNCKEIEKKWNKRFKKCKNLPKTGKEAFVFCNKVCDMLGEKRIKYIVLNSKDLHECAAAHYNRKKKSIHFRNKYFRFSTLMHELAHHFALGHGHDSYYCETLDLLFQFVYTEIFKKKMKPDW